MYLAFFFFSSSKQNICLTFLELPHYVKLDLRELCQASGVEWGGVIRKEKTASGTSKHTYAGDRRSRVNGNDWLVGCTDEILRYTALMSSHLSTPETGAPWHPDNSAAPHKSSCVSAIPKTISSPGCQNTAYFLVTLAWFNPINLASPIHNKRFRHTHWLSDLAPPPAVTHNITGQLL